MQFDGWRVQDYASVLHLLGLDREQLTSRHVGRDFRLTDVSGRVLNEILARYRQFRERTCSET